MRRGGRTVLICAVEGCSGERRAADALQVIERIVQLALQCDGVRYVDSGIYFMKIRFLFQGSVHIVDNKIPQFSLKYQN